MLRGMFSAVSGLRTHQKWIDVLGNNISNINTPGYKSSRVTFQDILSQTERAAGASSGDLGGTNPLQIGLGVRVSGIENLFTQGAIQSSSKLTDLAIQGDGFFIVNDGNRDIYTRDGAFDLSTTGSLVQSSTGYAVKGWQASATGVVDVNTVPTTLNIALGVQGGATQSGSAAFTGNLDMSLPLGGTGPIATLTVYDSLGDGYDIRVALTRSATVPTDWTWTATKADATDLTFAFEAGTATGSITFDATGKYTGITGTSTTPPTNPKIGLDFDPTQSSAADMLVATSGVTLDNTAVTAVAGESTLAVLSQDGFPSGVLTSYTFSSTGEVNGIFSTGRTRVLGKLSMAAFPNPGGLVRVGSNAYALSPNSGDPRIGAPGSGSRGTVAASSLEGSNVDLSVSFTQLISAQRGFQSNARFISTADEILQELVNLKR